MAIKKTELYSTLWQSCDELRGGMDASQYKDYVLILLFVKYVSDKYAGRKDAQIEVPPGASFKDMVALKGDKEIGDKINKLLAKLAEANGLQGVINLTDFNDEEKLGKGKEMVDRLTKLVGLFDNPSLNFSGNRAEGDDLLGDAYEFLIRHFATESGKSKGSFYTPAEVSRIVAQVIGVRNATDQAQTIYDPTCGSGSLLLKAHDEAKGATGLDLAMYGQEMDLATAGLARMNMILHDCATAEIAKDNTLSNPQFKQANGQLKTFDFAVANPPFSNKAWRTGFNPDHDLFRRFEFGMPPTKNGDYAFLLHLIASLKSTGKGAIILPHGVLFRGGSEASIRRELLTRGYLKGIIGLPANLFYGTGIPACILVVDKEHAQARKGVFMIDASKGFVKDGPKNRLRDQDLHRIVDTFNRQAEIDRYSRMVSLAEIADSRNDFNLNMSRYIDTTESEDLQDIEGHLKGGIPLRDLDALEAHWKVFPSLRAELIGLSDRPGYAQMKLPVADLRQTVFANGEFLGFQKQVMITFEAWRVTHQPLLKAIKLHDRPKALIEVLSEALLMAFEPVPLVDAYDVYQHLMTYWADTMQDDVHLLMTEGWRGAARLRLMVEDKDAKAKEKPDLKIGKAKYKSDLIPLGLVVARFFAKEQSTLDELEARAEALTQEIEAFLEEHGGEDGILTEIVNEKGKVPKVEAERRLTTISRAPDAEDERKGLQEYLALLELESGAWKKVATAQKALDEMSFAQFGRLDEEEIKSLVVDDKWLASLASDVQTELDRVSQVLTGRLKQLAERYSTSLPKLEQDIQKLSELMGTHLVKMGFSWN
jgi:type I restriction enzyme M protein